jgi:hypothetical protein
LKVSRGRSPNLLAAQIGWPDDFEPAILSHIKRDGVPMNFRIRGLEARQFDHLFTLSDAELAEHGAVRQIADGPRPCRISLSDAKPGDELILVNYEHHAVSSPYRMRFAIYIRHGEETFDAVGEVPDQLRKRTLAVRGFDAAGMMTGREIVEGTDLEAAIARQFAHVEAQYLHIHFAAAGCYAARVDRVGQKQTSVRISE